MNITYYGHACFSVTLNPEGKGVTTLLFDPFITGNELAGSIEIASIGANYILITHGHSDHIDDAVAIASRTGATIIAGWEVIQWMNEKGVANGHALNTGGRFDFGEFSVKAVVAQHSSSLPDGSYGGNPLGFIIYAGNESFYYSGDTALTLDMQLIPKWAKLNFAVLPIGDNFTMGYADAAIAAEMIGCRTIVGVHYDTFESIRIDHAAAKKAFADANCKLYLPSIGETISL